MKYPYLHATCYQLLLKTSCCILRILNFDWLMRNGRWAHIPLTSNMQGVRVFFAMIVTDFELFLVFSFSCLLDMRY